MSIRIDTTEVLHQLGKYGITSIENNAFKVFIRDLKKLIKYENEKSHHQLPGTVSSSCCHAIIPSEKEKPAACEESVCLCAKNKLNTSIKLSDKEPGCACNLREETVDSGNNAMQKRKTTKSSNRPDSTSCRVSGRRYGNGKKLHCDPVDLYQYYQSIWKHHKLPGENRNSPFHPAIRNR